MTSPSKVGHEYQVHHFDQSDGLKQVALNSNVILTDNQIWWEKDNDLTMLNLNNFKLPVNPPQINLRTIDIQETTVSYSLLKDSTYRNSLVFGSSLVQAFDSVHAFHNYPVSLTLPYQLNQLTFHFSAIDWQAPNRILYSHYLEGFEKGWSRPSNESKAEYLNLPYGIVILVE